jgi:hypothetical protein
MGLAFVGRDGIPRADWQSAHPCFWSLRPTDDDEKPVSPPHVESSVTWFFRGAVPDADMQAIFKGAATMLQFTQLSTSTCR